MKLYEIFLNIEVQSECKIVYYDYKKEKRIEVDTENYRQRRKDTLEILQKIFLTKLREQKEVFL